MVIYFYKKKEEKLDNFNDATIEVLDVLSKAFEVIEFSDDNTRMLSKYIVGKYIEVNFDNFAKSVVIRAQKEVLTKNDIKAIIAGKLGNLVNSDFFNTIEDINDKDVPAINRTIAYSIGLIIK